MSNFPCLVVAPRKWRYFVKLFDVRLGLCPIDQARNAEEAPVAHDRDNIECRIDVGQRVAIDEDKVGHSAGRHATQRWVHAERRRRVDARGPQRLVRPQRRRDQRAQFRVQCDPRRQPVGTAAETDRRRTRIDCLRF